jgi:hypothetical protein
MLSGTLPWIRASGEALTGEIVVRQCASATKPETWVNGSSST